MSKLSEELYPLDYYRGDFRYNPDTKDLFMLEVNAVCDLHPSSSFRESAKDKVGDYGKLIHYILKISFDRQGLVWN